MGGLHPGEQWSLCQQTSGVERWPQPIYTPLFSGVYWETLDTPLEDIERIEVIRGPGAAMWGANAVNGVINIITKHAEDTQGGLVSGGGGSSDKGFGTLRYGFKPAENSDLRLYVKHVDRGEGVYSNGTDANDAWRLTTGGFRLDSQPTEDDALTLQGDYYNGRFNETYTLFRLPTENDPRFPVPASHYLRLGGQPAGPLAAHPLRHRQSVAATVLRSLQHGIFILGEQRDTLDIDFQHRFALGGRQDILWGLGYRYSRNN